MSTRQIIDAFDRWRSEQRTLVLVTVYHTEGSTYSKAGHRILVADNGDYQGLVSGGCLEGDLAEHSGEVIANGRASLVTYDMRDDADELWGLGIGCNGLIQVMLQRLDPASDYEPFRTLADCIQGRSPVVCATIIESGEERLPAGATLIINTDGEQLLKTQVPDHYESTLMEHYRETAHEGNTRLITHEQSGGQLTVLYSRVLPLPRMLVLGAGLDAIPVVNIANQLGWRITIMDHRQAYLEKAGFDKLPNAFNIEPKNLAAATDLSQFSAAIVMSHHLTTDRVYLRQLAPSSIPYVGVLGPQARRDRLVADLSSEGIEGLDRIKGPIGLDIGADCAESIALSMLAEIYKLLTPANAVIAKR